MGKATETERGLHSRLLSGDPTASAETVESYLKLLERKLLARFRTTDKTLIYDAVVDAIMNYVERPNQFDPEKCALSSYLLLSARGDLLNKLQKQKKLFKNVVELGPNERNISNEGATLAFSKTEKTRETNEWKSRLLKIATGIDKQLLELMLAGERQTVVFARVLGISHLDIREQRRLVKQHKDRLLKKFKRTAAK